MVSVKGGQFYRSLNFVPSENRSSVSVTFLSGASASISEDRLIFGRKRHDSIGRLCALLRQATFTHRLTNLVRKLSVNGELALYKPFIGNGETVVLRKDGTVRTPTSSVRLKVAKASGTFGLGSEWHALNGVSKKTDTSEVVLSETRGLFGALIPRDALRFVPYLEDIDIVHALLDWLAKPANNLK